MEPNTPSNEEGPVGAEEARADKPLGFKQHLDGDYHLIGETIIEPTKVYPLRAASNLGTSPFVAREDHAHGLEEGIILDPLNPYIYFDPNTYFFWSGTQLYFVSGGTTALVVDADSSFFPNGSLADPSIAFLNEPDVGFYHDTAGILSVGVDGSNVADFTSARLYIKSGLSAGGWTADTGHAAVEGPTCYLLLGRADGANNAAYLRSTGSVYIGSYGTDRLVADTDGIDVTGTIYLTGTITGLGDATFTSGGVTAVAAAFQRATVSASWPDSALIIGSGGTQAMSTHWVSGFAPNFKVHSAFGDRFHVRNATGVDNVRCDAQQWFSSSSIERKQDIEDLPVGQLENIMKLRPVKYRRKKEESLAQLPLSERRAKALFRLNDIRSNQGLDKFDSPELYHDCTRDPCTGTPENPCIIYKDWETGNIGLIAEEFGEVYPEATGSGETPGTHTGIDSLQVAVLAIAGVQELLAKIDVLTKRVEELENA